MNVGALQAIDTELSFLSL